MTTRRFNPTTQNARKEEAERQRAHRIKLKKRLQRALKTVEGGDRLKASIAEAVALVQQDKTSSPSDTPTITATKAPIKTLTSTQSGHHRAKPNPMKEALQRREQRLSQEQIEREARRIEAEARHAEQEKRRLHQEQLRSKLLARTSRGQPRLANHVNVLLERIQRKGEIKPV